MKSSAEGFKNKFEDIGNEDSISNIINAEMSLKIPVYDNGKYFLVDQLNQVVSNATYDSIKMDLSIRQSAEAVEATTIQQLPHRAYGLEATTVQIAIFWHSNSNSTSVALMQTWLRIHQMGVTH